MEDEEKKIFERGKMIEEKRKERMNIKGGDEDLRENEEIEEIGKLSGGIVKKNGWIDIVEEKRKGMRIIGKDGLGVMRRIEVDMVYRKRNEVKKRKGNDRVEILGWKVIISRRIWRRIERKKIRDEENLEEKGRKIEEDRRKMSRR